MHSGNPVAWKSKAIQSCHSLICTSLWLSHKHTWKFEVWLCKSIKDRFLAGKVLTERLLFLGDSQYHQWSCSFSFAVLSNPQFSCSFICMFHGVILCGFTICWNLQIPSQQSSLKLPSPGIWWTCNKSTEVTQIWKIDRDEHVHVGEFCFGNEKLSYWVKMWTELYPALSQENETD